MGPVGPRWPCHSFPDFFQRSTGISDRDPQWLEHPHSLFLSCLIVAACWRYYVLGYCEYHSFLVNHAIKSHFLLIPLQSNRLLKIEGLDALVNLDQLYLSHNGIENIEGLEYLVGFVYRKKNSSRLLTFLWKKVCYRLGERTVSFSCASFFSQKGKNYTLILQVNLTTLDLAGNRVKRLANVEHLVKMEEFWVCMSWQDQY